MSTNNLAGGSNKIDDYFMYSDEEQIVSRNYLLFLEDRFSSKSNDAPIENNSNSNSTFGSNQFGNNSDDSSEATVKFKPADKLIIKAKVYILEILEVKPIS